MCQFLLRSFRCHQPLVIGAVVMRQIKGRIEHSEGNEKSEIQSIHFVKGARQLLL